MEIFMSFTDRIEEIREKGKNVKVPPDTAYFGGLPKAPRIEPVSEQERESIDQIDTTTPEDKLEKYQKSCDINIGRFSVAMLEHEYDEDFVAHLRHLIVSEITFLNGIAIYLGVEPAQTEVVTNEPHTPVKVGRLFVANSTFMKEFEYAKSME
jgi:hypothetical protein